jgi:tetratricopeptide (TPR) repeat protein
VQGNPSELLEALLQAAAANDEARLAALCRDNQAAVLAHFDEWRRVPEGMRDRPADLNRYALGLMAVAQCFDKQLHQPELLRLLIGTEANNPLTLWQHRLADVRKLFDQLRYSEAKDLLTNLLIDMRGLRGPGVDVYMPVTYCCLGECYFQSGQAGRAVRPAQDALELADKAGDPDGAAISLRNLYEIYRYLGQSQNAAAAAANLAERYAAQGKEKQARRFRTQARIVAAGEPLTRVLALVDGERCELDEVPAGKPLQAKLVLERNRLALQPSLVLTRKGAQLASSGSYEDALAAFRDAAKADPFDPHPHYEEGLTQLYLGRYMQAVECYETTEVLAPGWYNCRADLWLAQQLELGRMSQETFISLRLLEESARPAEEKLRLAEKLAARHGGVPFVCLVHGRQLAAAGRTMEAVVAYRAGLAQHPEPDVRTRLLVNLAAAVEERETKLVALREAVLVNGHLISAGMARIALAALAAETPQA